MPGARVGCWGLAEAGGGRTGAGRVGGGADGGAVKGYRRASGGRPSPPDMPAMMADISRLQAPLYTTWVGTDGSKATARTRTAHGSRD